MATKTPQKPDEGYHGEQERTPAFPINENPKGVYDSSSAEALGQIPTASQEGIDHLRSKHKAGELSGSDLKDKEEVAQRGPSTSVGAAEKGLMGGTDSGFYNPAESTLPPQARLAAMASRLFTKKNARNGGIIGGIIGIFIAGIFMLGSYEMVAVRENLLGRVNQLPNSAMSNRRINSFAKSIKDGKLQKQLNQEKFVKKMTARGFAVGFDPQTKKLNKLSFETKDAKGRVVPKDFDFNEPNTKVATAKFFSNDAAGKRAFREFQASTGWPAATWKGREATKVYAKYRISFSNWLDEPSTKGKTPRERFNEKFRKAQVETEFQNGGPGTNPDDADGDGKSDTDKEKPAATAQEGPATDEKTNATKQELLDDPGAGAPDPEKQGLWNSLSDSRSKGLSFTEAMSAARGSLSDGVASKLAGSLNATQVVSDGCRVKGVLNFIQNTKNVVLAYQVAKLAMLYNTAADHQKAGILSNQGAALYMQYLKNKQPTGKSYTQSGGFRSMMGDQSARPNKVNAAKYNTGRTDDGLLGDVRQFLNEEPVVSTALSDTSCKVVNNTFVQIGGFVAGGVAAFFSGGTTTAASVATRITIGLASNVAIGIGEQIFIKSATGMVLNGFEGGEEAGDAMSSGWGSMRGINAGANGLRPITKQKAVAMEKSIEQDEAAKIAEMPIMQRYFSVYNDHSLLNHLAIATPSTSFSRPLDFVSSATSSLSSSSIFGGLFRSFSPKSFADDYECKDPQVQKYKLKTDVFCNVEVADYNDNMNLDDTERILKANSDIDEEGEPVSEAFKQYIEDCHSGRTGQLYRNVQGIDPEKIKSGEVNPSKPSDVCIVNDPSEVAGDSYLDDVYKDGKKYDSGRFARYSNWFGYMTDQENLVDDFNDTRPSTQAQDGQEDNPSNKTDVSGSAQELAKKIIDSKSVTGDARYMDQIKGVANGDDSCHVNPDILKFLVGMLQKNYSYYISSLNRRCTGVLTASGTASYHYSDDGGHAVDIAQVNGKSSTGATATDIKFIKDAYEFLPDGSGIGQSDCRASAGVSLRLPSGIREFEDSCNHIHFQVPKK